MHSGNLPRASWANLLASSPLVITGLKSSSTAVDTATTVNQAAATTGAGIAAINFLLFDGTNYNRSYAASVATDANNGDRIVPSSAFAFNGATWDRPRNFAGVGDNSTVPGINYTALGLYNGVGVDRWRTINTAQGTTGTGIAAVNITLFDGVNYNRTYGAIVLTDASNGDRMFPADVCAFNGASFDRIRTNSVAAITATTQPFAIETANPGEWSITAAAGAGNQSTASRAAGAAGVRHVLRSFDFSVSGTAGGSVTINVRDGATGAGTILRQYVIDVLIGTSVVWGLSGLNQFGSAATAMTIEQAAGVANVIVTVNASGYDTI
jgi:hypothetical protein